MAQGKASKTNLRRAKDVIAGSGDKAAPARKARPKGTEPEHRPAAQTINKTTPSSAGETIKKAASKKDAVIALLSRKNGASIEELIRATGWQSHSVRGFLSGTIGKTLGLKLTSSTDASGTRRYAIKR